MTRNKKILLPVVAWLTLTGAGFSTVLPASAAVASEAAGTAFGKISYVTIPDGSYTIALHSYSASADTEKLGTFFVLHGYLEHAATRLPLITYFQNKGYDVIGIDLPGHGLSSGKRADIDDFQSYGKAFGAAVDFANTNGAAGPYNIIAHSTGCSAVLEYLETATEEDKGAFKHIIFESPLVRSRMWGLTKFGMTVLSPILNTLPSGFTGTTDQKSIQALKNDPLVPRSMPAHWVEELIKYEAKSKDWTEDSTEMLILFGAKDTVIDTKYTKQFLGEKFPQSEIVELPKSYHHIFKDVPEVSMDAWQKLDEWITD